MEMKGYLRKMVLGVGMLGIMAMPMVAKAGLDLTVNVGADDQAHFDFNGGHHHPMILKAARQLQNAKHTLWNAADDFHGHKVDAIMAINAALDQLKVCEQR